MNERMCILSRVTMAPEDLIRFVAAPDGSVVADLRRRLPGRGAHVEGRREAVAEAARKGLLRRALRSDVKAGPELADAVDAALVRSALGAMGLARKAGQLVTGAAKVDAAVRSGQAVGVLNASDAAADGVRKLDGALKAARLSGRAGHVRRFSLFNSVEMDLALGTGNVIHAAVLAGNAGTACLKRLGALARFRGESPSGVDLPVHDDAPEVGEVNEQDGHSSDARGTDDRRGTNPAQEAEA